MLEIETRFKDFTHSNILPNKELEQLVKEKYNIDKDFYVCEQHQGTGGFEWCCGCSDDGLCTEAKEGKYV